MTELPLLTRAHLQLSLQALAMRGHANVPMPDKAKVVTLLDTYNELIDFNQPDIETQYAVAIAHMIDLCHGLCLFKNLRFCIEYANALSRSWLSGGPYDYAPPSSATEEIVAAILDQSANRFTRLLNVVSHYCFDRATARMFIEVVEDGGLSESKVTLGSSLGPGRMVGPVRGFVAISMTDRNQDSRRLELISTRISETAADLGIVCFEPIAEHPPSTSRSNADNPLLHGVDERQVSQSDIVFIVASPPGSGLGSISELARRYGAKRLLIVSDATISPMLTGATPLPDVVGIEPDLETNLRTYLQEHIAELERRRSARFGRLHLSQEWIQRTLIDLSILSRDEVSSLDTSIDIDKDRFHALLTNAHLVSGMTFPEQVAIDSLKGHPGTELPIPLDAFRALLMGEAQGWWPPEDTDRLLAKGICDYRGLVGSNRSFDLADARGRWFEIVWWAELYDSLDE